MLKWTGLGSVGVTTARRDCACSEPLRRDSRCDAPVFGGRREFEDGTRVRFRHHTNWTTVTKTMRSQTVAEVNTCNC
jgi:hypothetical protein